MKAKKTNGGKKGAAAAKRTIKPGEFSQELLRALDESMRREWLEADGLGGYASGTLSGIRTRRYHAILLSATKPPTERRVLVNGLDEELESGGDCFSLSAQQYKPDVVYPKGFYNLVSFSLYPWPKWVYAMTSTSGEKLVIEKEIFVPKWKPVTVVRWTLVKGASAHLSVKPLLSGRDYHAMHFRNDDLNPSFEATKNGVSWQTYSTLPKVFCGHNGEYQHYPAWYYNFQYACEAERGLDAAEDLWCPGRFAFALTEGKSAVMLFSTAKLPASPERAARKFAADEKKRRGVNPRSPVEVLENAADKYIVKRGKGLTVVAGYPWFTDWGRDTFISLRGMMAAGRLKDAGSIILEWAGEVNRGMLPNHFPDEGEIPMYNSVDASLWYVITSGEYLAKTSYRDVTKIAPAIIALMRGYRDGTRFGIKAEPDGLLVAGEEGTQLTWMDAKVDDICFTPRIGKPVEIQALWLRAIKTLLSLDSKFPKASSLSKAERKQWKEILALGAETFRTRFWNEEAECLFDVIDGPKGDDASVRPNQLFAISVADELVSAKQAKKILKKVSALLATPIGLRSLSPEDKGYIGKYTGSRRSRDAAYHNGTVWGWLMGPYIEALVKTGGRTKAAKEAAAKALAGIEAHLFDAGLGHVSEVADGDAPYEPKGCPFQAWSVMEAIRLYREVL